MKGFIITLTVLGFLVAAGAGQAAPVQWAGNGHWYEAINVPAGLDWNSAKAAAQSRGGYLASVTSNDENAFVFSLIDYPEFWFIDGADNNEGPWLGGYYAGAPGTMNSTNWAWVSGEAFSYSAWDDGEPNFAEETALVYFSNDAWWGNPVRQPYWNNVTPLSTQMQGYVIEWNATPVPIPGAIWLLGAGLAGLAGLRRRLFK